MYIEQGYKGKAETWKYLIPPVIFIGFMIFNYISTVNSPMPVDEMMQQMVGQLGSNVVLIILLAPLAVGLFMVWGWVKLVHEQKIRYLTTSRNRVDWKRIFFAFFLWGGITTTMIILDYYQHPENYTWNFQMGPFIILAIIAVILIPMQTSFEEYMFRGYMMQGLGIMVKNRWFPLIVTSVLFGLMHLGNPEVEKLGLGIMVYYIGTGFFLGIITLMDEGMELALGFHAANNLFTALLVTSDWTAFQTNSILKDISSPTLGIDVYAPVFIIFPILIFIFAKKYQWKDWKNRLAGRVEPLSRSIETKTN